MSQIEPVSAVPEVRARKYRGTIPEAHRGSLDTRLVWLWHQRFGTVQTIWQLSTDILDHTACTLVLQAVMGKDLDSIAQLFGRIEGGALSDVEMLDRSGPVIRV